MYLINKTRLAEAAVSAVPLDEMRILAKGNVSVLDGQGREYFNTLADGEADFIAGGALGVHTIRISDKQGPVIEELSFTVDAKSDVDDRGRFKELFDMLEYTMRCQFDDLAEKNEMLKTNNAAIPLDALPGTASIMHNGKEYKNFVHWILDHLYTAKGFKYLSPHADGLVNLLKEFQREDGMIWSNIFPADRGAYFISAYGKYGYAKKFGDNVATRQPVENHCEFNYVDCVYLVWQSGGDDEWMKTMLESCKKALNYTMNEKVRWSSEHQLLKRAYTIDSWDFQPHDKYLVDFPFGKGQLIDPDKTKFTIFYGDNTGYAESCDELSKMLDYAGFSKEAEEYAARAKGIRERLDALAWNGKFYRHRIELDPGVKRDFGVDESAQLSFSNCYTLNRGCTREQAAAIIKTYMELRANLPAGSPGEFYSIYPPYEGGAFDEAGANLKWQYVNGGVHGHAAGELARGAFKHGFEKYGADILMRINEIGKKSSGRLRFAYTGAYEPEPPAQVFTPVDLSAYATMDLWNTGAEGVCKWMDDGMGNDLQYFPVGKQSFAGVPYTISDPAANGRKSAAAVSTLHGLPVSVEIPINAEAGSVYLLHTAAGFPESGLCGLVGFHYADGTECTKPVLYRKQVSTWYFVHEQAGDANIAWVGDTDISVGMGVYWAEIVNPRADKKIKSLTLSAGPDGVIYAVLGLTLADRASYKKPPYVSTGGPDNWSGGLCMAALMEGLCGITDNSTMYRSAVIAPRWTAAGTETVNVCSRYAASQGYVKYTFDHDPKNKKIKITATGSGTHADFMVLLPENAAGVESVLINGKTSGHNLKKIEHSLYAAFPADPSKPLGIHISYT